MNIIKYSLSVCDRIVTNKVEMFFRSIAGKKHIRR